MAPYTQVGKYILKRKIGEGAFAEVRYAVHSETKEEFAVKVFDRASLPKAHFERDIKKEIKIMQHLRHPNIVEIHSVLVTEKKLYLVMELVRGGELYDEIVTKRRVDERTSRLYFQQIVDAMVYCHRRGVVHRDLKPENLLLDGNGNVKITDFGMSWMKENIDPATKAKQLLRTQCGTPKYMPPEVIVRPAKGYDGEKLDAWECGMVLYALLAGYLPFSGEDDNAVFRSILNGELKFPPHFSPGAKDLLGRLLEKDPEKRSSLADIRQHFWFLVNYQGDAVLDQKLVMDETVLGPGLAATGSQRSSKAMPDKEDKENQDPQDAVVSGRPSDSPASPRKSDGSAAAPRTPRVPVDSKGPETGRSSLLALSFSPRGRRSKGGDGERPDANTSAADSSDDKLPRITASPRLSIETQIRDVSLASPVARKPAASPRHNRNRGPRSSNSPAQRPPPIASKIPGIAIGDDDPTSLSFRDRIRSPIASMFRSLRSGAGMDQDDNSTLQQKKKTTWFAETSPTAVDAVAQPGPAPLPGNVQKSRFSRSASSSEEDVDMPTDDYADDVPPAPTTLDKMARVFRKPARIN